MALNGTPFRKMNGLGNDFVVVDLRTSPQRIDPDEVKQIADRKAGIGCDQFIAIEKGELPVMSIWNADGSKVEACGNAARCIASILLSEQNNLSVDFETGGGIITGWAKDQSHISIDMGEPKLRWKQIPLAEQMDDTRFIDVKLGPIDNPVLWGPAAVNMGNPHCIFFVDNAEEQALDKFGPMIEYHPLFPEQVNVSIAEVRAVNHLRLRVWERGVGITKACGTAACAATVAAHRRRLTGRIVTVEMDGGTLEIEWRDDNHVIMTGPYELEFEGTL